MNSKIKKYLPTIMLGVGVLLMIGAICLIIFGVANSGGLNRVMEILIAILMVVIGVLLMVLTRDLTVEEKNFFLYDQETERNIPIGELKFSRIDKRMSSFLQMISENAVQMWTENIIGSDENILGDEGLFKPLVAYKMLYDLAAVDNQGVWQLFTHSSKEVIASLEDALAMNGDSEMGAQIADIRETCGEDIEPIRALVTENAKYIKSRMLGYVKTNIDQFYYS